MDRAAVRQGNLTCDRRRSFSPKVSARSNLPGAGKLTGSEKGAVPARIAVRASDPPGSPSADFPRVLGERCRVAPCRGAARRETQEKRASMATSKPPRTGRGVASRCKRSDGVQTTPGAAGMKRRSGMGRFAISRTRSQKPTAGSAVCSATTAMAFTPSRRSALASISSAKGCAEVGARAASITRVPPSQRRKPPVTPTLKRAGPARPATRYPVKSARLGEGGRASALGIAVT